MTMTFRATVAALSLATVMTTTPLWAQSDDVVLGRGMAGDIQIEGGWARIMPPNAPVGAGFFSISNLGGAFDRLIGGQSDRAEAVEVHQMTMVDDVMKMQSLPDGLLITGGDVVDLKPGGYHIMFIGVTEPFSEDEEIHVTVTFEHAGDIDLVLPVLPMQMD